MPFSLNNEGNDSRRLNESTPRIKTLNKNKLVQLSTNKATSQLGTPKSTRTPTVQFQFYPPNDGQVQNEFHKIRNKERNLQREYSRRLLSMRNKNNDRKRLSSAYSAARDTKLEGTEEEGEWDSFEKYHFLTSVSGNVVVDTANENLDYNNASNRRTKNLTNPSREEGGFFTPSLVDLCATVIADNFSSTPSLQSLSPPLMNRVINKLPVHLPLQISVPLIEDENYWKKCCLMRWSDGQIGSYLQRNTPRKGIRDKVMLIEEVSRSVDQEEKSWKQLYLERNLQEFLENVQSDISISRELHILEEQPEPKSTDLYESSELELLRSLVGVKKNEGVGENLETLVTIEENMEYNCLHSNHIRPNLNYYLLHDQRKNQIPDISFKEKMKELYDGSASRVSSRLLHLTSDDDIFTFYDHAIHRGTYKTSSSRREYQGSRSAQYWLSPNNRANDLNGSKIDKMFRYVKGENMKFLQELCRLSKGYVKELEILTLRSHINIGILFNNLSNLESLRLTYGVRNAGLTFDMKMVGMTVDDCHIMAESIANPFLVKNLHTLKLPENRIDDNMVQILIAGLLKNACITKLDFSHNRITAMGCKAISAYLTSSSLRYLDLSDNNVGSEGGKFLSYALQKRECPIVELNLRLNHLGDHGATSIARSLAHNTRVLVLNLSGNFIGQEGLEVIAQCVLCDSSVEDLDISSNKYNQECCAFLEECISRAKETKKVIQNLDIRGSNLTQEQESRIGHLLT